MKRHVWFPPFAGLILFLSVFVGCDADGGGGGGGGGDTGDFLNEDSLTLPIGGTFQLTADAAAGDVAWVSKNSTVATISNTGLVTANAAGTATVSVTSEDGLQTDSCIVTVTASFAVTFDTAGSAIAMQSVESGGLATPPSDPTRNGYTFDGWFADIERTIAWDFTKNVVTEPTTIYARWVVITYSVTYVTNGGTVSGASSFTINSPVLQLPVPVKANNSFAGWYDNNALSGNSVAAIPAGSYGDKTFYAKWVPNHTVSFNANGGTGAMSAQIIGEGLQANLFANAYAKAGYGFAGWATSSAATSANYAAGAPYTMGTANVTLYAVWKSIYAYTVTGGKAYITGFSPYWDGVTTAVTIPGTIDGYTVGSVGFENNTQITSVTIPNTVTQLAFGAFSGCSALTTVTLGSGITEIPANAFNWCRELGTVTMGASVTKIGYSSFYNCEKLSAAPLNTGLTSIGERAFYHCSSLLTVTIPSTVTAIGSSAFLDCYRMTAINVAAGNSNFASESGILYNADKTWLIQCPGGKTGSVTIPGTVISILKSAFYNCDGVTAVSLPLSLTTISEYAFSECESISALTLPSGLTYIGQYAFASCAKLSSITIPSGVTTIGKYVFQRCRLLTAINVDAGNTLYSSADGVLYDKAKTILLAYPDGKGPTFSVPAGVKTIADGAFWNCLVTSVTLPEGLLKIEANAFNGTSISAITIPSTVNSIGDYVFWNNYSLASITVLATTPPVLTSGHVFTYPNRKVYVPATALTAYQGDLYWGNLTDGATLNPIP